ncbi:hypothetical protein I3760_03G097400 [Carya illinoinensis]|nr:hypothetical protein I3760_03G097400 [Carya illinoinensis]
MQVLHAMIQMGVLVPTTGDMIAARDGQHSSSLTGEDLLAIAADQPFQFPATFTFVRAFSGNMIRDCRLDCCELYLLHEP